VILTPSTNSVGRLRINGTVCEITHTHEQRWNANLRVIARSVSDATLLLSALIGQILQRVALDLSFSQSELSQLLGASRPKVDAVMDLPEQVGAIKRTLDRMFCDPGKFGKIARRAVDA
jgi:predicted XRE-type DNA-binding protein